MLAQERGSGKQRNYVCSDDEKWADESDSDSDSVSDDESEIFENINEMNEMSCQYESEDSEQLDCRIQQQNADVRDYSSFSPMMERRSIQRCVDAGCADAEE